MKRRTMGSQGSADAGRRRGLLACAAAALALSACMGIDVSSVRRSDASSVAGGEAVAFGRIRWVVDGRPLEYGLLDKPAMLLFRRAEGRYLNTPEVGGDGRFVWALPPGEYGVAVLFGGMPPARQLHVMANGHTAFVNGIVDPGLEFTVRPGHANWIGTVVVEARSRPADALLGGRVFAELVGIRVLDDLDDDPAWRDRPRALPEARAPARRVSR